jgi:hypothetical protein
MLETAFFDIIRVGRTFESVGRRRSRLFQTRQHTSSQRDNTARDFSGDLPLTMKFVQSRHKNVVRRCLEGCGEIVLGALKSGF